MEEIEGQYMGVLRFSSFGLQRLFGLIDNLPNAKTIDTTSLLKLCLKQDWHITCLPYSGIFGECDNIDDIALYEKIYKNNSYFNLKDK